MIIAVSVLGLKTLALFVGIFLYLRLRYYYLLEVLDIVYTLFNCMACLVWVFWVFTGRNCHWKAHKFWWICQV